MVEEALYKEWLIKCILSDMKYKMYAIGQNKWTDHKYIYEESLVKFYDGMSYPVCCSFGKYS